VEDAIAGILAVIEAVVPGWGIGAVGKGLGGFQHRGKRASEHRERKGQRAKQEAEKQRS